MILSVFPSLYNPPCLHNGSSRQYMAGSGFSAASLYLFPSRNYLIKKNFNTYVFFYEICFKLRACMRLVYLKNMFLRNLTGKRQPAQSTFIFISIVIDILWKKPTNLLSFKKKKKHVILCFFKNPIEEFRRIYKTF